MSKFAPAPHQPDGRIFASYPMPAKIDLINERPRRESLVEKELENKIGEPVVPRIEISEQHLVASTSGGGGNSRVEPAFDQRRQPDALYQSSSSSNYQQQQPISSAAPSHYQQWNGGHVSGSGPQQYQQHQQQQRQMVQQQHHQQLQQQQQPSVAYNDQNSFRTTTTTTQTSVANTRSSNNAAVLAADLAEKEARLMAEINSLHARPYSPFQVPAKIDLTNEQRIAQLQQQQAPSPRPISQASSNKSSTTSADLLDKEAKLMQEIEEMERKPFNPQRMVVEREQWFEYPEGRPYDRQLTDSKRRVKDFCSLPSHMYPEQGAHFHEENLPTSRAASSVGSVHTTIIRSPRREIDNKSPLPFAFDNFSTKGVRGNIASVGAIEPDRPRPPIYPIIRRTPSPSVARG